MILAKPAIVRSETLTSQWHVALLSTLYRVVAATNMRAVLVTDLHLHREPARLTSYGGGAPAYGCAYAILAFGHGKEANDTTVAANAIVD